MTEFVLVAPLGGLVVLVFLYLRRLSNGPAATAWGSAWLALYLTGTLSTLVDPPPLVTWLEPMLGSLFPGLLLAGTIAFYRGRFVAWPVALAFALGLARTSLQQAGHAGLAAALAIPVELPMMLGAAGLAWRAAFERPRSLPEQLLGPTLVLLAFVNAADPLARTLDVAMLPLLLGWMTTSLSAAMLQVGAFVERARERVRRMGAERDLLYRVARLAASEPRDARAALDDIVTAVAALAGLDGFGVWLLDGEGRHLEVAARLRRVDEMPRELARVPLADPLVQHVFASDEPVTVLDGRRQGERLRQRTESFGIGETAAAPLRAGGTTFGAIFAGLGPGRRFEAADRGLLAALAQEIARVLSHARALEARAQQAAALDAEHRTLRALVESVPEGIVLLDREGRITMLSRLGAEHFGLGEPERWTGRSAREAFEDYQPRLASGEARRLVGRFAWDPGDVESFEVRFARPVERILELSLREVRADDGERRGQVWVTRDVTEVRRFAERLQRAQRMELLGGLAGGIAHDFNDQLTAVLGHARMLLETTSRDGEERAALESLERAASHCAGLTRALLDLTRRAPPELRAVDVEQALREAEEWLRATAPDLRVEIALGPELRAAHADPVQLRRVLTNLAGNARDAVGPRGVIRLAARNAEATAGEDARLVIEVHDDGCGMADGTLERAFEPFFTTKPGGKGTGLGLAIVAGIAEAHGATIEVESAPDAGTTVRLRWPAASQAPAVRAGARAAAPAGSTTVLVAEDEPALRRLACMTLERRGYRVLAAEDGAAALALFERHRAEIAIAVLDLAMPRMGGLDALRAMRASAPALPAVVMSGRVDPALEHDGRAAGARVLAKPFGPDELAEQVRCALAAASAARD